MEMACLILIKKWQKTFLNGTNRNTIIPVYLSSLNHIPTQHSMLFFLRKVSDVACVSYIVTIISTLYRFVVK